MKTTLSLPFWAFLISASSVNAAILFVDGDAGGNDDGSSWSDAYPELQTALAAAASGDEIWVAEGSYYPDEGGTAVDGNRSSTFGFVEGVAIYGGFDATEVTRTDRNPAGNETILSGDLNQDDQAGFQNNSDNAYHVLLVGSGISSASILDGFTVTAGSASALGGFDVYGGGVIIGTSSSPRFVNCSFVGNRANDRGGAVFNFSNGSPTFTNCSFEGNIASREGGAIFNNVLMTITLTNCAVQGYSCGEEGGGLYLSLGSSTTVTNCSLQGNRANLGGGVYNESSDLTVTNSIIWNNRDFTGTGTGSSAFLNNISSGGMASFEHCLVQGDNPSGTGNLDGTDVANDPLFVLEVDPENSPVIGGDLRLQSSSVAIDMGDDAANSEATDLAGNARLVGTIDLGAYEFFAASMGTFATFFPGLAPTGDANGNGRTNYYDYAAGGDPTAANEATLVPCFSDDLLTFSYRNNATDVFVEFEKSETLLSGSWDELVEGTDYTVSGTVVDGPQTLLSVELLTAEAKIFFRQSFSETAP